jgi:HK97 family phage portal protein
MGFFKRDKTEKNVFKMITMANNGYFAYDGKVYQSDLVRSCLRPYVKGLGKTVAKHIVETEINGARKIQVNPHAYIRFLLEEPNPVMTFQKLIEKTAISLKLNGNAFIFIARNQDGLPEALYPVPAAGAESVWLADGELGIRFYLNNGTMPVFRYSNLIHLRGDYGEQDVFGDSIVPALQPLMEEIYTIDRGLMSAIKNSAIIRWILKITQGLKGEDIKQYAEDFVRNYMNIEEANNLGVAAIDSKAELTQVKPEDYVPNAAIIERVTNRVYKIFNTNDEIVTSKPTEDQWNSYYEAEIEPDVKQLQDEFTRKIFTRRERGTGNRIVFEAYGLSHASFSTKMQLVQMVDRGALTPNEWRSIFNLSPIDGGDEAIRRLDTAVVNQIKNLTSKITGKNPENDAEIIKTINRLIEGR